VRKGSSWYHHQRRLNGGIGEANFNNGNGSISPQIRPFELGFSHNERLTLAAGAGAKAEAEEKRARVQAAVNFMVIGSVWSRENVMIAYVVAVRATAGH